MSLPFGASPGSLLSQIWLVLLGLPWKHNVVPLCEKYAKHRPNQYHQGIEPFRTQPVHLHVKTVLHFVAWWKLRRRRRIFRRRVSVEWRSTSASRVTCILRCVICYTSPIRRWFSATASSSSSSSRASPRPERSRFHELPPSSSILGVSPRWVQSVVERLKVGFQGP